MGNIFVHYAVCSFLLLASGAMAQSVVVLDDFTAGVVAQKNPTSGGNYTTWYDSMVKVKGSPAASNSPTPGAMMISESEIINGVYRVFQAPVPSTGSWHVNCKVKVVEAAGFTDVIKKYQLGVIVNGTHRSPGNTRIAPASLFSETESWYLTPQDDSAKDYRLIRTPDFIANAGDNLLISLGTDVASGNFNLNSGIWGTSYVLIDDIVLEAAGLPVSMSSWTLE